MLDPAWLPANDLVGEVAPVVLEDEADRGEHREHHPDQEEPPADREAKDSHGRGEPEEQRPPAVRAEEPDLAGALRDLAGVVVFRALGQAAADRKSTRLNSSHVRTSYAGF